METNCSCEEKEKEKSHIINDLKNDLKNDHDKNADDDKTCKGEKKCTDEKTHHCYIVYDDFNSTYNGYTCNLKRRIRQHNAEIKGGARFTTRKQSKTNDPHHWKYMLSITSNDLIFDYKKALSLEWSVKNPTNKRTRPKRTPLGRIESLPLVFSNPKFKDLSYIISVYQESFLEKIVKVLENYTNIQVVLIDNIDNTSNINNNL